MGPMQSLVVRYTLTTDDQMLTTVARYCQPQDNDGRFGSGRRRVKVLDEIAQSPEFG